jgi:hypothetical protein
VNYHLSITRTINRGGFSCRISRYWRGRGRETATGPADAEILAATAALVDLSNQVVEAEDEEGNDERDTVL